MRRSNLFVRNRERNYVPGRFYQRTGYYVRGRRLQRYTLQIPVHKSYAMREAMPAYSGGVGGILIVVVALLLVATLFQSLAGATPSLTFSGLLQYMSNAPELSGDWMLTLNDLRIYDDWGLFNFFRDFLNIIMTVLSSAVFLCTGVAQLIVYMAYIIGFLFGG